MNARWSSRAAHAAVAGILVVVAVWCAYRVLTATIGEDRASTLAPWFYVSFILFTLQMVLCHLERPVKVVKQRDHERLARLKVWALVPAYNEDPSALRACVMSILEQTRKPAGVVVIDDGSSVDYTNVRAQLTSEARRAGVRLKWLWQENSGKREAQAFGVVNTPDADVYLTSDSDSIYDPHALEELLKPFIKRRVMSVAGLVLAANASRSLLCRITDLWFVTGQLVDRSSLSRLRSVWVNSGPIAVYRASVIRDNLHGYLNETFFGRPVKFSDDSLLTLYAMLAGDTVQQPTAYVFSLMPENWSHHRRQYLRWMRGSFIRSWWRIRYLPLTSVVWWLHLVRWVQVVGAIVILGFILLGVGTSMTLSSFLTLLLVPVMLGYAQTLRYLSVVRNDVSTRWSIDTWLMTPLAVAWSLIVLRALRWYAFATCWKTGWGTRKKVEVSLVTSR